MIAETLHNVEIKPVTKKQQHRYKETSSVGKCRGKKQKNMTFRARTIQRVSKAAAIAEWL